MQEMVAERARHLRADPPFSLLPPSIITLTWQALSTSHTVDRSLDKLEALQMVSQFILDTYGGDKNNLIVVRKAYEYAELAAQAAAGLEDTISVDAAELMFLVLNNDAVMQANYGNADERISRTLAPFLQNVEYLRSRRNSPTPREE